MIYLYTDDVRLSNHFLITLSWSGVPLGTNPLTALMDGWLQGPRSGEMPGVDYADRGDQGGGGFGSQIARGLFKTNPNWGFAGRAWQITSRFTLELPQTLLGLGFAWAYGLFGGFSSANYHKGIGFYESSRVASALSLSHIVLINPSYSYLKPHEYGHSLQSMILGPLYVPLIVVPSILSAALSNLTYSFLGYTWHQNMPWERWADRLKKYY